MKSLGQKQHSSTKGLGMKHFTNLKSLGVKGVFYKQNVLTPKAPPLDITGFVNKSNSYAVKFLPTGLKKK